MEIEYNLTEEDYLHFNLFHIKNSKTGKKSLLIQRLIGPVIFIMAAFIFAEIDEELSFTLLLSIFIILSILWYLFYPKYFFGYVKRHTKKLISEGTNNGLIGKHVMTLDESGVTDISTTSETKVNWSGIQELKEDKEYLFLYNSAVSACILPKRDLENPEDIKKFVLGKIEK
jgi:hypothetical protein